MRGAADWVGRTLFLILSGLATYALLLSILSISANVRQSAGQDDAQIAADDRPRRPVTPERPIAPTRVAPASGEPSTPGIAPSSISASNGEDAELRRWAEALTWAVLAMAGFAAAIMIVLLKITAQLARIANGRGL